MKENGEIKSWDDLNNEFKLEQRLYFKWMPLVNAIQSVWKNNLKHSNTNSQNLILVDHHLVKSNSLFSIEKADSRELYCIINYSRNNKPHVTNIFWKEVWFEGIRLEGHLCITTKSYHKYVSFQYKILNKILYLNEKRFWLWTFYNIILLLQQFFWWQYNTSCLWLYNNTMSLEKITVEIERWFNSSSTITACCHLRRPWSRLPILLNAKPHSSHFKTVHIQFQKQYIFK